MRPPQAQLRPMPCLLVRAPERNHVHRAAVCSTFLLACPQLSLVATSAATWQAARSDALEKQNLGSNLEEGRKLKEAKIPAQGRCGAIGRRASRCLQMP